MKGLKWKSLTRFVSVFTIFVIGFALNSADISALDFDGSTERTFTSCTMNLGGYTYSGVVNQGGCTYIASTTNLNRDAYVNSVDMQLSSALPGKSLVIVQGGVFGRNYKGFEGNSQMALVASSMNHGGYDGNVDAEWFWFTNIYYTPYPLAQISLQSPLSVFWLGQNISRMDVQKISVVSLTSEPTRQQITAIQDSLGGISAKQTTTNSNLEIIRGKLDDIMSNSDRTADAVEEQNEKDDEDRSNIESQSSDAQDGADDSQEEAESTGTTLLQAFTSFVNALTSASPSNCNLDMDLGNLDLGVVNLCSLNPPAGFSTIASIFLILFCVPLSIATARKVISLFRSFQT